MAVGDATPLALSTPPQGPDINPEDEVVAAATFADPSDQSGSSSAALLLLFVVVLCLSLGYVGIRIRRSREERRLEALWRQRDAEWGVVVRQIETERALFGVAGSSAEPSVEQLQKIDAK